MTPEQLDFCKTVATALKVYREHHPDYEISDEMDRERSQYDDDFKDTERTLEDQRRSGTLSKDEFENKLSEAKFIYYRRMNKLLREVSGVGVPEPYGTGNPRADYQRAMNVVDR